MEVCKVSSKKDFIAQIVKLCNNSAKLGLIKGPSYIKNGITSMIELAKASSEPEQQIQLLKETLNDLKQIISDYFARQAQEEINRLWETGELNKNKVESFRNLHERTPYK